MLQSDLTHNQDLIVIYTMTMFGTNWSAFVDAMVLTKSDSAIFANSRGNNSDSSGPIKSKINLIQDLMVTYILSKFGANWLVFVDARV